ncbi:golgin subfamily A member 6-like protein 22 isoform X3 [Siniperca chuatsi]|uniref:golgin subfamily A member 6-like protein 22 isoform X3 n=1 Tax=Siniperca chuatsi TaxID=119488 RepID=UPI001CE15A41|nr:golgin subfamily A member 6-like protein 22 isoform X3 [Siniperca chuatsi]
MLKTCTTMNQKTTSPESGDNSKLSGHGSDALNLPSPSGEVELKVAIQGLETETNNVKQLLYEFKGLYEQRLRFLELDNTLTREELMQKKVNFLWSYVNDLAEQNQVLVQTIEDLQKEADHKVSNWGMKLRTSDRILDVSEVDLRTLLLDELVGPEAHIPHSTGSLAQNASELEDLKIQLQTKDMVISYLERKHRENFQQKKKTATQPLGSSERLVHLQSELSCLQRIQKDNIKEIAEKDICITKLQANIQLLQQEGADTHAQLSKLSVRVREVQEELKRKEEEWKQREDERRLKHEKERQKAEERRGQEQQKREEEWVKKVEEEKKREEEWRRVIEEERKAHDQAIKRWAEKAAILNSELKVSRKQVERQNRELSEFHQKEGTLLSEMKEREEHVRHLDQDAVGLRATQDSLKRTLAIKEKHTQQLVQDNTQLKESLASLQSKLQTSLNTERQQRQQIQDQLHHANKEMERLQLELTHVRRTTEKKIQKREIKMCALVKELTEIKKQHSECQKELLRREEALEKQCEERDELRAKMEDRSREFVHLNQTKERLEADLAVSHEKLHTSHLEVRSRDQFILQLRAEMKTAEQKHQRTQEQVAALEGDVRYLKHKVRGHQEEACHLSEKVRDIEHLKDQKEKERQQLHDQLCISQQQVETFEGKLKKQEVETELLHQQLIGAKEELKDASLQAQEQKETVAIFKQKYTAALEKVHRVQGQVELLEEELQYSQQQLRESQLATHSVKEELAEMVQRYREKVGQWESSLEALDQLTDELQANQNLLRESQQKVDHLKCLIGSLQEQVDTLKQQKLMLECDLQLYQQSHSHSDEEYLCLLRHRQQLQKRCTEQVDRLAECEKAILQMKSGLERQTQEKVGLKQSLVASHHTHISNCSQLEQEVMRLKKEVTRLELELADTQKVHVALLRQTEEELKEARREAVRRGSEVDVQRGEVQRLQEELQKEEEKMKRAIREKQSLSGHIRQLSQELEELCSKHQVTVEELAARAEEARRMEGCLNEGKLAEEKIRSVAVRLETEVAELRRDLQQAVDHKLKAEREKKDAQDQVDTLRSDLEGTRSDNANLRHESQLVMTNVNRWITEQKASNESLTAQMKAQNKVLLIITEEKEHLQEANDTLKAEVKRLKEVADEKERDMEHFKAQIRDQRIRRDERTMEKQGCVALNLSKIEDMQTRLRSNLEAIRMLNQQLNTLSRENKRLRRQLEEERFMRRQVEQLLPPPPTSQDCSSVHLPVSLTARPPPPSTSLPSSLHLPHPLSLDTVTGDIDGILTQTKLS